MAGTMQILIADDDPDLLDMLALRCRAMGLDVITASDAMDALANADFYAPQIALLDVRMPGGNGISVAEMLATDERLRQINVIVMTADRNEIIEARCSAIGAELLMKDGSIWARLESMLSEWMNHPSMEVDAGIDALTQASADPEPPSAYSMFDEWRWVDNVGRVPAPAARLQEETALPWVLAIDDDPDFSIGLQGHLVESGVRLVRAFRGSEGCRAIFKGCPEAVLLDCDLPDANGEYVLRRLRESPLMESVPILMTSERHDASMKRRMLAAGASDFLVKPLSWERIKRSLLNYTDIDFRPIDKQLKSETNRSAKPSAW
ncbi:MAG: response regulator [Planctomycetota bacterium]